jgi:hypothetical protein
VTQPWLKVYPERMLGDAKLSHLSSAEHWWLIVCLHIAANAEPYGQLRLPSGKPYNASELSRFLREPQRKVEQFLAEIVATGIAETNSGGALRFPNLARLQGQADSTATMRKRRQRDRDTTVTDVRDSHGDVTDESVTSSVTSRPTRAPAPSRERAEGREEDLSRNRSSKPRAQQPATHGDGTDQKPAPTLPPQLARILDPAITRELKPSQISLVTAAWNTSTELRHSLADIEAAENPTAMLVSVAKRIAPADEKTPAQREAAATAKRAGAVQRCRYLWHQALDDNENMTTVREDLERQYRHDPSIVTEAIGPDQEDVAL